MESFKPEDLKHIAAREFNSSFNLDKHTQKDSGDTKHKESEEVRVDYSRTQTQKVKELLEKEKSPEEVKEATITDDMKILSRIKTSMNRRFTVV